MFYLRFCVIYIYVYIYIYMSAMDVDDPAKPSKLTIFKYIT